MKWISTKIRFPKAGEQVLTACKNKNMEDGIWLYDLCYYFSDIGWAGRKIGKMFFIGRILMHLNNSNYGTERKDVADWQDKDRAYRRLPLYDGGCEEIKVSESISKTFTRVNEFEVGSSYRR